MATITDTSIAVSGARDLTKASARMMTEVLNNDYLRILKRFGVINYEPKLSSNAGTTVTMYNTPRIGGMGQVGDVDQYSNATPMESGSRSLSIRLHSKSLTYSLDGTERQQVSEFSLKARAPQLIKQWGQSVLLYQCINQLGGNTATTLNAPGVDEYARTSAADRLILTGHNSAIAPSTLYHAWGNQASGSISADESVDSDNPLTLHDFLLAREVITSTAIGVPTWQRLMQTIDGITVDAIALVSTTGMNQLHRDATTVGQGASIPQYIYAMLAGGQKIPVPTAVHVFPGIPIGFLEIPDNYMPRGVNSSSAAAVANTRRAILCGANAVDFALGKGYQGNYNGKAVTVPGFTVETDEEYKKLNNQGYITAKINGGWEKVQITGTGANTSTAYDNSTYIITHYSRT